MAEIKFSEIQVIKESTERGEQYVEPSRDTFDALPTSLNFNDGQTLYEINVEKSTDYIYWVFRFGNPTPRDNSLIDIQTFEKRENMRKSTEAELNNQAFFLYHFGTKRLYASNTKKKKSLEMLLRNELKINFVFKDIYKDVDEFLGIMQECEQISFTHINNLFSDNSVRKQALVDLTGTDSPAEFTIRAKYKKHQISNFIRNLSEEKQNHQISSLVVCGKGNQGFDVVYNTDSFQQKIKISLEKNEDGMYDADRIKQELLLAIK